MQATTTLKPNWLAIFAILTGLIVVGWLLGVISGAPDGQTLECPQKDMVQIIAVKDNVVVYCDSY